VRCTEHEKEEKEEEEEEEKETNRYVHLQLYDYFGERQSFYTRLRLLLNAFKACA
jgi:hypothetical protein